MLLSVPFPPAIDTSGLLCVVRAPVSDPEVSVLKAFVLGVCVLALLTQAAVDTDGNGAAAAPAAKRKAQLSAGDRARIARGKLVAKVARAERYRRTIRYYETHRKPLQTANRDVAASVALRSARAGLARTKKEIVYYRRLVRVWTARHHEQRLRGAPPRTAICGVFGRYCRQAVAVAWCESRLSTAAQNGQYLGLFQMGSNERQLFGHGESAYDQSQAAHRYFVSSGRDWSPWGCRWAAS